MEKQFYITNKHILNKEGRQVLIFFLVCNAHCSLHFHSFRIDNVCEGDQVFQGISVSSYVWEPSTFYRRKLFSPFLLSALNLEFHLWRLTPCHSALVER